MRFIGLDAGSVSVKTVIMDDSKKILHTYYERHKGHPLIVASKQLGMILDDSEIDYSLSVTGSGGKLIAEVLDLSHVNEIVAQSLSTNRFLPLVKTIIEMGGEDSKLIVLDGKGIKDFSMNSVCAAGTGSFLDQQAERLKLTIEEFSELATKSKSPPRIAGRCSVFAKSDMIHLQQIATPIEDIIAGLCFAVARNFKGAIVKGRTIFPEISFQGGVAANDGMVRAFKEVFDLDELTIPEHFAFMGSIGAVLKDMDNKTINKIDLKKLEEYIRLIKYSEKGRPPLISKDDNFLERHILMSQESGVRSQKSETYYQRSEDRIPAYLGIDIGSISTNLAVIDIEGRLLAKRYLMTSGRPIEAVMQGLGEIGYEVADKVDILAVGTTGSGRYMISDFVGADIVKNEITAQARAAIFINKDVDTIFEIGGQDSKYISIENGVIIDFEMNKACAAGTGSFLEEQAEKLSISIKKEFADCAFSSDQPCNLGERCTVFMENSLMANLQRGAQKDNLLAGLSYSIVENYINRVVAGKRIGKNIFFQGGTAFNKSVVAAFEKFTDQMITVPPNHDVTGAIGMALIAKENREMLNGNSKSSFKGFELSNRTYSISSFECKGCSNICDINRVKIEGEKGFLFYGGRCEKYDINKKDKSRIENHFKFREDLLWGEYGQRSEDRSQKSEDGGQIKDVNSKSAIQNLNSKIKIGIPYIFFSHDYLPFWIELLSELDFDVVISPKTNRQVVNLGVETILAESCFPVKVAHGHIKHLLENGIKNIMIPSYINLNSLDDYFGNGSPCPYTQTIPYLANAAFKDTNFIRPVIDFSREDKFIIREINRSLKQFSISSSRFNKAYKNAKEAQDEFFRKIKEKGGKILYSINERTIVIVGRAYNAFDSGINLQIPEKLATLNVSSIPMDFLPLDEIDIIDDWPDMYWKSGQEILKAARFIKNHPLLYPIYIGNFNCGPDSFILKYFKEELGEKPFLHLEIDEHSADAGAITRCEAFLDSIGNRRKKSEVRGQRSEDRGQKAEIRGQKIENRQSPINNKKTVFIPRMCDHAFAIAAAFEYSGISAEVLPETDRVALDLGRKYASGKECYPCIVTTGDMVKKAFSSDFDPDKSVFFMPSGTGPCRFGQYNVFHKLVLNKIGHKEVPIFSPVQDTSFYSDLGIAGDDFVKRSWQGIIAIEFLTKCLHETRPYEKESGISDIIYKRYLDTIYNALRGANGNLEGILKQMRKDFESISRYDVKKPLIGIIGEIFVRSNKFSNEDLVKKVESLGGAVWLAPIEEWLYYVNHIGFKHNMIRKNISESLKILIKGYVQKRIEHQYQKHFKGFLKTLHEPLTKEILKKARPYIHESFEGEAVLSMGKSVDLAEHGVAGIINAMPFGCMPGTIVTALLRKFSSDYNIPYINIPYDGTESTTSMLQLEAFMEQAKAK